MGQIETKADALIRGAIADKRLIQFSLHGRTRIAEPHDYGIRKGMPQLLVYQVGGESKSGSLPNWRWVQLSEASDFRMLDQTFRGQRTAARHNDWDELFMRVDAPKS